MQVLMNQLSRPFGAAHVEYLAISILWMETPVFILKQVGLWKPQTSMDVIQGFNTLFPAKSDMLCLIKIFHFW